MHTNCKKCQAPNTEDNLSPEGDCWACSIDGEGQPNTANVRESMDSIANDLAVKVGDLKVSVKKAIYKAAKDGGFN